MIVQQTSKDQESIQLSITSDKGLHMKVTKTHKETSLTREQRDQPLSGRLPQGCKEHQDRIAKSNTEALPWNGQ